MSSDKRRRSNELGVIAALELCALRRKWTEHFGAAPAQRLSRELLIRGIAYRIQEKAQGGLSKVCLRQLKRLGAALNDGRSVTTAQSPSFKPGTKLIREWKGTVHEVVVAGDTYSWAGRHYRSLSEIARAITGTRWSGPRFFGMDARQRETEVAAPRSTRTRVTTFSSTGGSALGG